MKASRPVEALQLMADDAVELAHQLYCDDDDYESCQVLMAARVFKHALETFVINRQQDDKRGT